MPRKTHAVVGHGQVVLRYGSPAAAQTGWDTIWNTIDHNTGAPQGGGAPTNAVINSIDHLADENSHGAAGSDRVLLEIETTAAKGSQVAHNKLNEVGTWARGLSGAPGVESVWCCYSDH